MSLKNLNPRLGVLLLFMLAAGIIRVLSVGAGTTDPAGQYHSYRRNGAVWRRTIHQPLEGLPVSLLTLFISDIAVQQIYYPEFAQGGLLYQGWIWTYLGFAAMVLVGQLIIKKVNIGNIVIAGAAAAVAHWLISDFGVWMGGCTDPTTGQLYPKTMAGLLKCYAMAVPYMKYMFFGNVVYGAIFFGLFELMKKRFTALAVTH